MRDLLATSINDTLPRCNVQRYAFSENKMILPYSRRDYFKIWIVDGESILHYASKSIHITQPALTAFKHHNATSRIANLFIELLERQFPIDTPDRVHF